MEYLISQSKSKISSEEINDLVQSIGYLYNSEKTLDYCIKIVY